MQLPALVLSLKKVVLVGGKQREHCRGGAGQGMGHRVCGVGVVVQLLWGSAEQALVPVDRFGLARMSSSHCITTPQVTAMPSLATLLPCCLLPAGQRATRAHLGGGTVAGGTPWRNAGCTCAVCKQPKALVAGTASAKVPGAHCRSAGCVAKGLSCDALGAGSQQVPSFSGRRAAPAGLTCSFLPSWRLIMPLQLSYASTLARPGPGCQW